MGKKARKKDFTYGVGELRLRVAGYFEECEGAGKRCTFPGLCLRLDISPARLSFLLRELERAESGGEGAPPRQEKHLREISMAVLRLTDALEQRSDSAAMFLLRQPFYGGYSDKPGAAAARTSTVRVTLAGMEEGEDAFG